MIYRIIKEYINIIYYILFNIVDQLVILCKWNLE